jgi:hypothetical protein
MTVAQPIGLATRMRARTHAAALSVLAVLALAVPAPAVQLSPGATSTSPIIDPSNRCDLKSAAQIERSFELGHFMPISSYDDDPFVRDAVVECVSDDGGFARTPDGRVVLANSRVTIEDEPVIYRLDRSTGLFGPLAWNPWPVITVAGTDGSFRFPNEPRFPVLEIERGPDGRPLLRDGLQVWRPLDLHRGMTTVFEAANKVKDAAEEWSGRHVAWGVDGILAIEAHTFVDYNAFYSPSARMIFFGVVPYRLPNTTTLKIFETATSWEMAAHEVGHAVHHPLKPNADGTHLGFRTWAESFADQATMWTQLRDPGRVQALLRGPDLHTSNALSRIGEASGVFFGTGEPSRDAVNDATVSTTSPEIHDRSEVLTGAVYRLFLGIYEELRPQGSEQALRQAGDIMGIFLAQTTDHTPENRMTLEDVGKAYLKVDAEIFDGRYRERLVDEFRRREIFDPGSLDAWLVHEASLPDLRLAFGRGTQRAAALVGANLDRLGIAPGLGLVVSSLTRDERFRRTIVRVQLTLGRDAAAVRLDNHGVLVFREDGSLADYHAPLPPGVSHAEVLVLIHQARHLGIDAHGAPLSIVRGADGTLGVEARILRGDGPDTWVDAFTLDAPHGERRAVVSATWGGERHRRELERAGIIATDDAMLQ